MKCFIEVYGCQMNTHDGEILAGILSASGHEIVKGPRGADAVFVVTCAVREHAETRAMGRVTHLAGLAGGGRKPLVVICGCVAQEHGEKLLGKVGVIDLVVGPDCYHRIPELIAGQRRTSLVTQGTEDYEGVNPVRNEFPRAFVTVMRGCDNFCSYCIVPFVRGRERSRPVPDILREVEELVEKGYREITLLGQNVNSYRQDGISFPDLLRRVSATAGEGCRIRFVTSHPGDLTLELAETMASLENVCEQFHLPAQSGSDAVLKAMNRGYTRSGYLKKVAMLRRLMPGIVLSTDMIAGFPGETPEDFRMSVDLLREVGFDYAFLFRYSERKGTAALEIVPSVPVKERLERLSILQEIQTEITLQRSRATEGKTFSVLVTGKARDGISTAGRTRGNRTVILEPGGYLPGDLVDAVIVKGDGYTHFAEPVSPRAP